MLSCFRNQGERKKIMTGTTLFLRAALLLPVLLQPAQALAHGASCRSISEARAVEGIYHDGMPMAFCDVTIYSTTAGDSVFATGTTDAAGRFAFVPAAAGEWRIVIDDGMGHAASCEFAAAEGTRSPGGRGNGPGRLYGGITGVSLIFGIFGLYTLIRSRRVR